MRIEKLKVKHLRNLQSASVTFQPGFNIILGPNGSGKTSLLESIYILGYGRSFRCSNLQSVITHDQASLLSCAQLSDEQGFSYYVGMEKGLGRPKIRVAGKKVASISSLIAHLPALFISPESFSLLVDGPEKRRKFLDWGTFHSHKEFNEAWKCFNQVLKQRNAHLKSDPRGAYVWDEEFILRSEKVNQLRARYLEKFLPKANESLGSMTSLEGISIDFFSGWEGDDLKSALQQSSQLDARLGYTTQGPHRADLLISVHDHPASKVLSRGQLKMLICALYVAQGRLLSDDLGKQCIYLIDDLCSELDKVHRESLLSELSSMEAQCFVTGIEPSLLQSIIDDYSASSFYVQNGLVEACPSLALTP